MKKNIKKPSVQLVNLYIEEFNKEDEENPKDSSLELLFSSFKENIILEEIYLKVNAINSLYSTNIYDLNKIAKHILKLNIDEKILIGDSNIVNEIATGHNIKSKKSETGTDISFYSFASKYCSWSNKNQYPIFDSFVEKVLINYRNQKLLNFKNEDLRNYPEFKNIINTFRNTFGLTVFSYKELDKFLWKFGKKEFSTENNN